MANKETTFHYSGRFELWLKELDSRQSNCRAKMEPAYTNGASRHGPCKVRKQQQKCRRQNATQMECSSASDSDASDSVHGWYNEIFGAGEKFWTPQLLRLAQQYIKHAIRSDNGQLNLKRNLMNHISCLIMRYGFRAKLRHAHSDINNIIRVMCVPPSVHASLNLEVRRGFSVYDGVCFNGRLAHPRMEAKLKGCKVIQLKCFTVGTQDSDPNGYEEMHDVYEAMEQVDHIIEDLRKKEVGLILCSERIALYAAQKLYLSGITCVTNIGTEILTQFSLNLGSPILEHLDRSRNIDQHIGTVEQFHLMENGGNSVVALSLGAGFHGCSILYSTSRGKLINVDHMKDVLMVALFKLQGLFEELTFVKDLGGRLQVNEITGPERGAVDGIRTFPTMIPEVLRYHSMRSASYNSSPMAVSFSPVMFASHRNRKKQRRWDRKKELSLRHISDADNALMRSRSMLEPVDSDKGNPGAHTYFSDWLMNHIQNKFDLGAPLTGSSLTAFSELHEHSVLRCLQYYTNDSVICGAASRKTVAVGTYQPGQFLSDFLYDYGRDLHKNRCISSAGCSDKMTRHHLHLDIADLSPCVNSKRATLIVENRYERASTANCAYSLEMHCGSCGNRAVATIHDLTLGRFLQMLLYDRCYFAKCGHYLFANHRFTVNYDHFSISIRVQEIVNYRVGAWFKEPLYNSELGSLPLFSIGTSKYERKLLQCSSKLQKLFESISDVEIDTIGPRLLLTETEESYTQQHVPYTWEPHDPQDLDLLHLRDRSNMITLCLKNLLKQTMGYMESIFAGCIAVEHIEDALPCRCRFSLGNWQRAGNRERSHWILPLSWTSVSRFKQEYEDRNAFGLRLHPMLMDSITMAINEARPFASCDFCQQSRFNSIAELEILNWIYIMTGTLKSIGSRVHGLTMALEAYKDASSGMGPGGHSEEPRNSDPIKMDRYYGAKQHGECLDGQHSDADKEDVSHKVELMEHDLDHIAGNGSRKPGSKEETNGAINGILATLRNCMEDVRASYLQCVSHGLFSIFWLPLDPIHQFMVTRCFFVSVANVCRSVICEIRRNHEGLIDNLHVVDSGIAEFCEGIRGSSIMSEPEASISDGDLSIYDSVSSDESPRDQVTPASQTVGGYSRLDEWNNTSEQQDDGCLCIMLGDLRTGAPHGARTRMVERRRIKRHDEGKCSNHMKHTSLQTNVENSHWCPAWKTALEADKVVITNGKQDPRGNRDATGNNEQHRRTMNTETITIFIQRAFNIGLSTALGETLPDFLGTCSPHQMVTRMCMGLAKDPQSVIAVDHDMVQQPCRDIGNIIGSGLISQEYHKLCQSNFESPLQGNLCRMGKAVFTYCKNAQYRLMGHLGSVLDSGTVSFLDPGQNKDNDSGSRGIFGNSLLLRSISSHSGFSSIFRRRWAFFSDKEAQNEELSGIYSLELPNVNIQDSIWTGLSSSDSFVTTANLICHWRYIRNSLDKRDKAANRSATYKLCSITKPWYGTPVVICSHRLLNYQWCDHKSGSRHTVADDGYLEKLFSHGANDIQALRSVVDGTIEYLFKVCIEQTSSSSLMAYLSWCTESVSENMKPATGPQHDTGNTGKNDKSWPGNSSTYWTMGKTKGKPSRLPFLESSWNLNTNYYAGRLGHSRGLEYLNRLVSPEAITRCQSISLTNSHSSYVISYHYPEAFHMLHHISCGDGFGFARSLCRSSRIRHSGGKSGAPLFLSYDGKYIIKLLNRYEFQLFLDNGPRFFEHVLGGGTLLSIPYGLCSIEHKRTGGKIRCLIMQNVDYVSEYGKLTFDLKGISHKRYIDVPVRAKPQVDMHGQTAVCGISEFSGSRGISPALVLLDQNFKEHTNGCPLRLNEHDLEQVLDCILRDLAFLSKLDVVDYSLLLRLYPEEGVLVLGIIDYLRPYTWDKQIETIGKKLANLASGHAPTIVSPMEYKARFLAFFNKSFSLTVLESQSSITEEPSHSGSKLVSGPIEIQSELDYLYSSAVGASPHQRMRVICPVAKRYLERLIRKHNSCADKPTAPVIERTTL